MYYRLKENLELCGWERLPYALCERGSGKVTFLSELEFQSLSFCNGFTDVDSLFILPVHRDLIEKFYKANLLEQSEDCIPINEKQKYKLYPSRYMGKAHWSITGKCNYKCKHCYMSAPNAKFGELTYEQCEKIIEDLSECGVKKISLTGGEPLIRKDFLKLVDKIIEKNIYITQIYSNGKLVTPKLLSELEKRNVYPEFNMSFDGVGWHDWLRGIDGAEEAVINAFKLCRERGFPTGAEMCIHKKNKHTLRESINLLASLGVRSLKTNPVSPSELWSDYQENYGISNEELFEVYLNYIPYFYKDNMPINLMLGGFFYGNKGDAKHYSIPSAKLDGTESMKRQCMCGHARNTMYISAEGRLLPCMPLSSMKIQENFPNVLEIGLQKGLTESYYMSMIDLRLEEYLKHNPECNECKYKYICGGGCRGGALSTSQDYMSKDMATCLIFKGGYVEKIRDTVNKAMEERCAKEH